MTQPKSSSIAAVERVQGSVRPGASAAPAHATQPNVAPARGATASVESGSVAPDNVGRASDASANVAPASVTSASDAAVGGAPLLPRGPEPGERVDLDAVKTLLTAQARSFGFDALGVASVDLAEDERHLISWLDAGFHGEMDYMRRHGSMRSRPQELSPGTVRVVSVRMNYWPAEARDAEDLLAEPATAYISRYALGRDYHKVMRRNLARLAEEMSRTVGTFGYRVCVDSAPVLEKALARNAGLGWIGKHTNLIARDAGSLFFLGEILTDLPLPLDAPASAHCGTCTACMPACPTQAIVAPYRLDARRCISYLTIEHKGSIPVELRPALGNRIYGCDDCQLVCPWNKFAQSASHPDFKVRHRLDSTSLVELFAWTAEEFEARMQGSAIYRIGYERWLRNIAVALGNAPGSPAITAALLARRNDGSALVREHVEWALGRGTEAH